jgi:hypothetical protein
MKFSYPSFRINRVLLNPFLWMSVLLASLLPKGYAQIHSFRELSLTPDQELRIKIGDLDAEQYYRLVRFDFRTPGLDVLDVQLISANQEVELIGPAMETSQFFRVEAIPLNAPLDADRDGLDDRFELENRPLFNPLDSRDAYADFDGDGVNNRDEQRFGSSLFETGVFPVRIAATSPINGDDRVSSIRKVTLYFDQPLDPCVLDFQPFTVTMSNQVVAGDWRLSSTGRFVTFFPDAHFPAATEMVVLIDGDAVIDGGCAGIDGNGNLLTGGSSSFRFRTLPLTRMENTNVFGYVRDSFSGNPIAGATVLVDNIPSIQDITDNQGRFDLSFVPGPEFFVHVAGVTATNAPEGMSYPIVGKVFQSVPGQTVQISKDGVPFDIFLPPLVSSDYQTLSADSPTEVGLGAGALANAAEDFPDISAEEWARFKLTVPPNSAVNNQGVFSTQATVIPVPPDRIPEPLPSFLDLDLVVSIQIPGASFFDAPAPVTFPNTNNLPPGSKAYIFSFDHDLGQWKTIGTGTVSADGLLIESDPGVGILAPGWHGVQPGTQPTIPLPDPEKDPCEGTKVFKEWKDSQLAQLKCVGEFIPLDKLPKLGIAGLSAADKMAEGISSIASQTGTAATVQGTIKSLSALKDFTKTAAKEATEENPVAKLLKVLKCVSSILKETIEFGCELSKCLPEPYAGAQATQQAACVPLVTTLDSITKTLEIETAIVDG